jgi:hypothetical protein
VSHLCPWFASSRLANLFDRVSWKIYGRWQISLS